MNMHINETPALYRWSDLREEDTPRARLKRIGAASLSDRELLSIVMNMGEDFSAMDLLARFDGSLTKMATATVEEIQTIRGIGEARAAQIHAALILGMRAAARVEPQPLKLNSPSLVAEYLHDVYHGKKQEEIRVLLLDTRNQLISDRLVTKGLLTTSQCHPREVYRPAIREAAARVILAHNHPSGDPEPSKQDLAVTENILKAGETVGIPLVDHVIIGAKGQGHPFFVSLRQRGHCE